MYLPSLCYCCFLLLLFYLTLFLFLSQKIILVEFNNKKYYYCTVCDMLMVMNIKIALKHFHDHVKKH